jgi:predicted dehydrogenase
MKSGMGEPKTVAIVGGGGRGYGFAELIGAYGHLGRVVAVAEPRDDHRAALARTAGIPPERQFRAWQEFAQQPKLADAAVIATMDREHSGPAIACLDRGYDLLLEKPMAPTLEECRAIEAAQRRTGRIVAVCHSMRYQKGFRKVKDLLDSGAIGEIVTLDQIEQVAYWHQAHSFVRGNWGSEARSAFMLLAKSCHDLDYIAYLVERPCLRVCSFGALTHFRRENAPPGSTARCTDGCPVEPECPYSAIRAYVQTNREEWPACAVSLDHRPEAHWEAIRTGPYGRCVYLADNDVVDHQVVLLEFEGAVTATFTMTAFTQGGGRKLRVHGTRGDLAFDEETLTIRTFGDHNVERIAMGQEPGGHGGGDHRVVGEWLRALHTRDDTRLVADAQESLRTHTMVFAAERSRRERRLVELAEM